ncbi:hypothetical protein [Paracoccus saliphilus]|uniref:Uncharacterized protein n=1 Tax=Paracoccus saliphilus TaxID=405559 RepID=A0AA46A6I0_9RHOB|nr:hypothetical protein [Paracoccus saliphilus]WCR01629.1 hypothetical protein JHX88_11860 [Paracoccus saliphilus]SIS98576.1 hypothetical protein SAMN05421772_11143 [Paracoccus saliphilus]
MPDYQILSATPKHRVVYHRAESPSRKLIVTFSPINEKLAYSGFGTGTALSLGYDTVYVGSHHKVMHRSLDIETVERLIAPVAAGREIVAYGASAGAYAALYFGGQLNAKIIGFSPRLPVHPYLSGNSEKSINELEHVLDLKDVPKSEHKPIIIYDPMDKIDAKFADHWVHPGYPDAHVYLAPMAGHGVISRLKETGNLKNTIKAMFEGHIPKEIIVWNKDHHNYHYTKGYLAAGKGSDRKALYHFKAALKIAERRHIYFALIQCARRLGDSDIVNRAERDAYRYKTARQAAIRARKMAAMT